MEEKRIYRRNLPHIQPEDGVFFITFRLDGSLPIEVIKKLQEERDFMIAQIKKKAKSKSDLKSDLLRTHNIYFGKFDTLLDNPSTGLTYLADKKDRCKTVGHLELRTCPKLIMFVENTKLSVTTFRPMFFAHYYLQYVFFRVAYSCFCAGS